MRNNMRIYIRVCTRSSEGGESEESGLDGASELGEGQ